jgi:hypothetical protein
MQVQCGDSGLLLQSWNPFWVLLVLGYTVHMKSRKIPKIVYCRVRRAFTSVTRDWVTFNLKSLMMSQCVHLIATAGLRLAERTCRTGG